MASILQRIKIRIKRFEDTFHPAHAVAGLCDTPTIDQVKDLLEHGGQITERAKNVAAFANSIDALGEAGEKVAKAAEKLNSLVEKGAGVVGDVSAACEISEAISILNDWSMPHSNVSNAEAAKAFDQLFGGAARFFKKLPPPVNAYARILEEIARVSFFSNMQEIMDPESDRTITGIRMRGAFYSQDHND